MRFWPILSIVVLLVGCYEPKEGCLDIDAVNYDVSADDGCPDCCKFPVLSLLIQHHITLPSQPDSSFSLKYGTKYQSPFDTNHFFIIDRGRFLVSDLKLVAENGEEIGVRDSFWLPLKSGDSVFLEDNFSKHDRDIFQTAPIGTVLTSGFFTGIKFTLGLSPEVQQAAVDSIEAGHTLALKNDNLSYDSLLGFIPFRLTIKPDTLPGTLPIDIHLTNPKQISIPFPQPVSIERGFNIKLTLRINYMVLFQGIDFQNDSPATIQTKIDSQVANAFSIVSLQLE